MQNVTKKQQKNKQSPCY